MQNIFILQKLRLPKTAKNNVVIMTKYLIVHYDRLTGAMISSATTITRQTNIHVKNRSDKLTNFYFWLVIDHNRYELVLSPHWINIFNPVSQNKIENRPQYVWPNHRLSLNYRCKLCITCDLLTTNTAKAFNRLRHIVLKKFKRTIYLEFNSSCRSWPICLP